MSVSPFPFHGPLEPELVVGRDDIVSTVIEQVTHHRPTVLVAPRRFGKTSILRRVGADLADTTTVINVDLYELRSWADLAARLDDALDRVAVERRADLARIAAGLELNLGVVKATFSARNRPEPDLTVDRLLDVIVTHGLRTPTVVVFDEFSSVIRLDGAAGLLRTKLQHHYTKVGLLFAGSEPSTMRMLFSDADQPFYAQADLLTLPGLSADTVERIIASGFGDSPPPGLASRVSSFARGHPQRIMQLADAAWHLVRAGESPDVVWEFALERVRQTTADGFEIRFAGFAPAEQAVARLVANDAPLHGRDAEVLSLSSSSADRAKRALIASGHLDTDDAGRIKVIDPMFADWLRRRFPI